LKGSNTITFKPLKPGNKMQIDLQPPLVITRITHGDSQLKFWAITYLTNQNFGIVSEPRAVATGSGGPLEIQRDFLIRSLPLAVLTQK
jgi:hypothetical protein